jgi:hypothetical protein
MKNIMFIIESEMVIAGYRDVLINVQIGFARSLFGSDDDRERSNCRYSGSREQLDIYIQL